MGIQRTLCGLFLTGIMVVFMVGCQTSSGSQHSDANGKSKDLVVYVTSNAQMVREKALSYGLQVRNVDSNTPAAELIQALLNSPSSEFFAVINPSLKRYIAGGALSDQVDPASIDNLFRKLSQINRAGHEQMDRLKPSKSDHARLVVFSDYQCPYCKMVDAVLPQWKQQFGDKLEIEFINFPLPMHENAFSAAEAAECVRSVAPEKFDSYKDALFDQQKWLGEYMYTQSAIKLGVDKKAFYKCWSTHEQRKKVRWDQYFAQYLGISGTPTMYLNGESLSNVAPDDIPAKIQERLSGKPAETAPVKTEAPPPDEEPQPAAAQ